MTLVGTNTSHQPASITHATAEHHLGAAYHRTQIVAPQSAHNAEATSTLRRCAVLAARARMNLLSRSHPEATAELLQTLEEISAWDPETTSPDPRVVAVAHASLEDLQTRLLRTPRPDLLAATDGALHVTAHLRSRPVRMQIA